jgi:polar amino acid transport system permease protein
LKVQLDFLAVLEQWPLLLQGAAYTVALTTVAALFGVLLGVFGAWARNEGPNWLKWIVSSYVEAIRNTPFIVQLFVLFFGLPSVGIKLSAEVASALAMIINLSAYATEIVRAGIQSISKGQLAAGRSLGLNEAQVFRLIVLPQGMRNIWPAMVSQIIIVMLGSAVCGQIATAELSYAANLIQSRNFRAFESFIIVAAIYLALAVIVRAFLNWFGPALIFGRAYANHK